MKCVYGYMYMCVLCTGKPNVNFACCNFPQEPDTLFLRQGISLVPEPHRLVQGGWSTSSKDMAIPATSTLGL